MWIEAAKRCGDREEETLVDITTFISVMRYSIKRKTKLHELFKDQSYFTWSKVSINERKHAMLTFELLITTAH